MTFTVGLLIDEWQLKWHKNKQKYIPEFGFLAVGIHSSDAA